jgi:hypothetical protein
MKRGYRRYLLFRFRDAAGGLVFKAFSSFLEKGSFLLWGSVDRGWARSYTPLRRRCLKKTPGKLCEN